MMSTVDRCPSCGSAEVRGGKLDLPGGDTLYEFACRRCGLAEERLRTEAGFDAWRARWATPAGRGVIAQVVASGLATPASYRAVAGLTDVGFTGAPGSDGAWQVAALELDGRVEVWLFTDPAAVAACQAEVGAARLGDVAPPTVLAPVLAGLPPVVDAVWINPFDAAPGLVVAGPTLRELVAWGRRVATERAIRVDGAAGVQAAPDLALAVIDGTAATVTDADGEWLIACTAPDAGLAYAASVAPGTSIAFVHDTGAAVLAKLSEIRTVRPGVVGVMINPAGPAPVRVPIP
ncbi:MAG: hypothetical protein R3B06_04755 [Kofleriaceae bacterium]